MAREFHTDDVKIDQRPPVPMGEEPPAFIVHPGSAAQSKELLEELQFMQDPVTIRLEPMHGINAPRHVPAWTNGHGADVLMNGRWVSMTYLPVGQILTVRRHTVERFARAKQDDIKVNYGLRGTLEPINDISRVTSSTCPFSVINDPNPRGPQWLSDILQRNT